MEKNMSKLKSRADEILDGLNDPETLDVLRQVHAKIGVTYSDERIDRLTEKVSFIESVTQAQSARIVVLEKLQKPVDVNVTADTESLTAYVHRLETLINDTAQELTERLDVHRADIDALERRDDFVRPDTICDVLDGVRERLYALERAALPENENDRPQHDTSWHPHEAKENYWSPVLPDNRVVVMIRGSDEIQRPDRADNWNWGDNGYSTIIAWRYAKEGE
jgi:hypothetical protein